MMRLQSLSGRLPLHALGLALTLFVLASPGGGCHAQELEPRRWSHLPIDTNFFSIVYGRKDAQIDFDPVLRIENATQEMQTIAAAYTRTFELVGKVARFDLLQAWSDGEWAGSLDGMPASTRRQGLADTRVRLSMDLLGAPPLAGEEYAAYRAKSTAETIVGVGLAIELPTGQYDDGKLINLGSNRFGFNPQLGVVHSRGDWSLEATGSVWLYTANDSFFHGNKLEQQPLWALQAHVTHDFTPRLWLTGSAGYELGGRTSINGEQNDDRRKDSLWALTAGYALTNHLALKAGYVGKRHRARIGSDSDAFFLGISAFW